MDFGSVAGGSGYFWAQILCTGFRGQNPLHVYIYCQYVWYPEVYVVRGAGLVPALNSLEACTGLARAFLVRVPVIFWFFVQNRV